MNRKLLFNGLGLIAGLALSSAGMSQTTFSYTGAMETYTVPAGVSMIQIECWGAQGEDAGSSNGGLGGYVSGELAVTPGEDLYIFVGGQTGFNGGGTAGSGGGYTVGRGGGASDVRQGGMTFSDRVIVAGGGGGAGRSTCTTQTGGGGGWPGGFGGFGDGIQGGNGTMTDGGSCSGGGGCASCCSSSLGGGGGGQDGGGAQGGYGTASGGTAGGCGDDNTNYSGGCGNEAGGGGCFGTGGDGINPGCNGGGGGGGGGWYGGGSGGGNWGSGGGGGSSYLGASLMATSFTNDTHSGDGQIVITELCSAVSSSISSDTICYGDSLTLTATSVIGGTLTWDNGAPNGTAFVPDTTGLVTYTTSSDTTDCAAVEMVMIQEGPDFTLSSTDELIGGDGTATITVTGGIFPFTYDWDIDGTGDFDDDENQSGLSAGTYVVTVMHGNGCTKTDSVVVNSQLGIDPNNLSHQFVYPSPTNDVVNITLEGDFEYTVSDATGRVVKSGSAENHTEFSLLEEANGVYLVTVNANGNSRMVKVVKK